MAQPERRCTGASLYKSLGMTIDFRQLLRRFFDLAVGAHLRRTLLALVLVGLAAFWAGLLSDHRSKERGLEHQTHLRSAQLAQALAVQSQTLFAGLDFVTQNLVAEYSLGTADGFDLAVRTATSTYPPEAILQIAVANGEGRVVYSSLQSPPRSPSTASIRDRAHFLVHAQTSDSGLHISHPLMGRVSQRWTIQISRAIRKNGVFAGVVVVSVAPSYLSGFFREILEHPNSVVMLLRQDGAYLARSQQEEQVLGKFVPGEREFLQNPGKASGTYDVVAPVDGVLRHYSWHRVQGLPLLISIGLDKNALSESLLEERRASLIRSGIWSALVVSGALLVGWLVLRRREAQNHADRTEALLRDLVDQVPGVLFQLLLRPDHSPQFCYVSPGLEALHHVTPEAAMRDGKLVFDRIHPDDLQRVSVEMRSAGVTLSPWRSRYRISEPGGMARWMRATARPERSEGGGVLWHGYLEDVTLEHEIQEALRLNEEHLRLTMEAVNDGLWQWSLQTDQIHWDARCWEMLGHPAVAGELSRNTVLEWTHPSDRERYLRHGDAPMELGEPFHREVRLRTADGHWLWVEVRGNVIESAAGKPLLILGTHTDISERVAQSQLLRALLDENAAAIVLATPDRRIVQANQRAQGLFGAPGTSLEGQSLRVVHTDDASFEAFGTSYGELRERGLVLREWRLQLRDGTTRWCEVHGTPLDAQDPEGRVIWTIVDADERHRAQAELRVAQQRLTAIIDRFPAGVLVQEKISGPIVAMNHALCDLLGLEAPVTGLDPAVEAQLRELLPAQMLVEPTGPGDTGLASASSVEQALPDGRVFEIHRVPLWEGIHFLGVFWMVRDITERKQRESTLEQLASTDALTALPNRRSFMARLQREFDNIRHQEAAPGVLLMLDIDFFKKVNDTWGHAAGDQVLRHLAGLLRQSLRQRDIAGRLGGEEFAVLLADTDLHGGLQLAERLRAAIAATPAETDQGPITFTTSVGVSVLDRTISSIDAGLERADAALYYAKRHGRNRVCAWSPQMAADASAQTG